MLWKNTKSNKINKKRFWLNLTLRSTHFVKVVRREISFKYSVSSWQLVPHWPWANKQVVSKMPRQGVCWLYVLFFIIWVFIKNNAFIYVNKTKVISAVFLEFDFDLDLNIYDIFRFCDISVKITFQFWWHISFGDISVLCW